MNPAQTVTPDLVRGPRLQRRGPCYMHGAFSVVYERTTSDWTMDPGSRRCRGLSGMTMGATRPPETHQSSTWLTNPSASFGSNHVDLGGMTSFASATAMS